MGIAEFVGDKLHVGNALAGGGCEGAYVDAVIIVAALVSGMASNRWPGKGIDRQRFVKLWVGYSGPEARRVSVPLITQWLRDQNRTIEAEVIERIHRPDFFGPAARPYLRATTSI